MAKRNAPQPAPTAPTALQALVATVTTQAPVLATVPATTVVVPATAFGLPFANLSPSQQRSALAKAPQQIAPQLGGATLVLGKPYRTKNGRNIGWWGQITAALATGPQTGAQLAAACSYPGFVAYCVKNRWLVPSKEASK